ncbi:MAG: peptide deformylase [Rhodothermia bacterium]|nr:MAG: peptide deformylase [Rhodothermia bacterium]
MVLPIYLLGTSELRKQTRDVETNSEELQFLVDDMVETMHACDGIGLAAPQIGRTERLFVVDVTPLKDEQFAEGFTIPDQPIVFINAKIIDEANNGIEIEEGCLSIPDVHEEVVRADAVKIRYLDREMNEHETEFEGILARVIQHECDHVDGILFIDHISPFRRRLLKRKLREIIEGQIDVDYPTYAKGKGILSPET